MTPRPLFAAIASLALPAVASAQVQLSEIRVGQPGLDTQEYVELRAQPGTSLAGLTLVVIGDGEGQSAPAQNGFIEEAVALSGSVGSSRHFVLAEATFTLTLVDLVRPLNFEDPDNVTFLLVSGFSGSVGQSLDTNFDGTLDVTPWASVIDSVAIVSTQSPNGTTSDFVYSGTRVGPDGATSPSYVWRCSNTGAWTVGAPDLSVAGDTPGAENPTCSASGPVVRISEIRTDMPGGTDPNEYFELQGPPGTVLNGYTYIVLGDAEPTNDGYVETVVSLDGVVIPPSGYLLVAEPTFNLGVTPDFVTAAGQLNFENSDNVTHMLVRGFTGALDNDLHTGTSCVLDSTPWTQVVDAVGIKSPDTTCIFADEYVGPDGTFAPGHIYRCSPDGEWELGAFTTEAGGDTPGAENRACSLGPPVECGDAAAGSCSQPRTTPYCSNSTCCTSVCTVDPTCCQVAWDADCVAQAAISCATGGTGCERGPVNISEVRLDMPSTDTHEFVEVTGPAGQALDVTIVIIGDGTVGSGVVERARSLVGITMPSDGTLLVGNPAVTPDVGNGGGTGGADLTTDWIENNDNITILLVRGWTGSVNADLDTNDDGTFDVTPWTEIVDSIAVLLSATTPPVGTEYAYGTNRIGPDGNVAPRHVWRCTDTGCWNIGLFDRILNAAAGNETPGTTNAGCGGGGNPCPADINGDGSVGGLDLTALLAGWGGSDAEADIDGDGTVGGLDLTALLAAWGNCP
ncbi:MAG: hypothetical protein FGM37_07995 [Phycisphaerales bacterium]|nr:hypothetical protein [Phycisphaerales bacterium]